MDTWAERLPLHEAARNAATADILPAMRAIVQAAPQVKSTLVKSTRVESSRVESSRVESSNGHKASDWSNQIRGWSV